MSEPIQIRWAWDRTQYLQAERESWRHAPGRSAAVRRTLLLSALGFAVFAGAYWQRGILSPSTGALLALLAFGLPWLGQKLGEWAGPRVRAHRFAKHCLPAFGETRATVAPSGLALRWQDSGMELGWSTFLHAVETPSFFLLYHSPRASYLLPKASIDADVLPAIRDRIATGLSDRGGLTSRPAS